MKPFENFRGIVLPLDRANVDTDAIIPKQFLKSIKRTGFGPNLFDEWRYLDQGEPGQDCTERPLNPGLRAQRPAYAGADILLTRHNFGCGSSREHAPWALADHGFPGADRAELRRHLPPERHQERPAAGRAGRGGDRRAVRAGRWRRAAGDRGRPAQPALHPERARAPIEIVIDPFHHHCLIHGLDDIGLTLEHVDEIAAYEQRRRREAPWLFA
jgi:3-isopropylmalate/(R)-2-methylmalate dehydratase small subunit